jgi:hypothetical protein
MPRTLSGRFPLVLAAALLLAWPWPVSAAPPITVGHGTPASCTEQALQDALTVAASRGGRIRFRCGRRPATISLTATLVVPHDTTIDGGGRITLDGNGSVLVVFVEAGSAVVLKHLTVANGGLDYAAANRGTLTVKRTTFADNRGGAIYNEGTLTVTHSAIVHNGGGLAPSSAASIVHNLGALTLRHSTLSGNVTPDGGGLYNAGLATIEDSTLTMNVNVSSWGGAIVNAGKLTIRDSTVSDNWADLGGGGVVTGGELTVTASAFAHNAVGYGGGGLESFGGRLTIRASTFAANRGELGGGVSVRGGEATIVDSELSENSSRHRGGGIQVSGGATVLLSGSTVSGNTARSRGGGIANLATLTVRRSRITHNTAGPGDLAQGGGIYTQLSGTTTLEQSVVTENTPDDLYP